MRSKLKSIMEKRQVTIGRLHRTTGLSVTTILKARGPGISSCTLDTLLRIANALNCHPCDLFELLPP